MHIRYLWCYDSHMPVIHECIHVMFSWRRFPSRYLWWHISAGLLWKLILSHIFDPSKSPHHRKQARCAITKKPDTFQKDHLHIWVWLGETNFLNTYTLFDLWPLMFDLPLAAACRLPQEMLPAECGRPGPNVGFDPWPAMWIDWQLSKANNNAGYWGKQ